MSLHDPFSDLDGSATPATSGQPIRRRDLREPSTRRSRKAARDRALAAQAATKNSPAKPPSGRRSAAPAKPGAGKPKKPLGKRIARRAFAAGALSLVVAYAAVQVLGLLAPTGPAATASTTTASATQTQTTTTGGQTLTASGSSKTSVQRDGFAATSIEAYGQIQDLADAAGYTVNNSGAIRWPFDTPVPLGDPFGPRVAPCAGCSTFHNGTDFETGDKAPVYAVADGVVTVAGVNGDLGESVSIDHDVKGYLFSSVYGHMTMSSLTVKVGQTVKKGQLIGLTGSTGQSTGPHLFFEIDIDGTPIDSFKWLKAHAAK